MEKKTVTKNSQKTKRLIGMAAPALAMTAMCGLAGPAQAVNVDGVFGGAAEGYTLGFDVQFKLDNGDVIDGGELYLGTGTASNGSDDDSAFIYFRMDRDFVDNSYGDNQIGWGDDAASTKNHNFKDLVGSDKLHLKFFETLADQTADNANLDITVDYLAGDAKDAAATKYGTGGIGAGGPTDPDLDEKNDGKIDFGDASSVIAIGTALDFNLNQSNAAASLGLDELTDRDGTAGNSPGFTTTSTDPDDQYASASAAYPDWIFQMGYELEIDGTLFLDDDGNLAFSEANLMIADAHVSPRKAASNFDLVESLTPIPVPGDTPDTPSVPEPAGLTLFGAGLLGLGWLRRRRRR